MGVPVVGAPPEPPIIEPRWGIPPESLVSTAPATPTYPTRVMVAAFWVFILGGMVFGLVFLSNWRVLLGRPDVTVSVPGAGRVAIGNLPVLPLVGAKGDLKSNIASAAINLLPEWKGTDRVNILLLGIDKREDEPIEGTRTDSMILLSVDPVAKTAAMISLPRDMWVSIPPANAAGNWAGWPGGEQRINVAHAVGGPELAKKTITADFGIPVRYYARVDFRGFQKMVDTVGGVMIDVDRPIKDDEYPTEDYGYQRIYIAPGPQLMDGVTALQYARSRHSENDFGRAKRQQRVIVAVRDRAMQLNMLPKAPDLLGIVQQAVSTDIGPTEMLALARLSSEIDRGKIDSLVIDAQYVIPFTGLDGAALLRPDYAGIRRAIDNAFKTAGHPELRAKIEILNGTARSGLAQQAADYLSAQGFNVVRVAPADTTTYASSSVQSLTGNHDAAAAIAGALQLPASSVTDVSNADAGSDVRITLGQDFQVPARSAGTR